MNTRTTMPLEQLGLEVGEEVDIWRKPSAKDIGGWAGPCQVVDLHNLRKGHISVKHQRDILEAYHPHIQRHMTLLVWFQEQDRTQRYSTPAENAWRFIRSAIDRLAHTNVVTFRPRQR